MKHLLFSLSMLLTCTLLFGQKQVKIEIDGIQRYTFDSTRLDLYHGSDNTIIGWGAGYNNDGNANTILGALSGLNNTSGSFNILIGANSGYSNTTGGGNVFVGTSAGGDNKAGSQNVYVGNFAGMRDSAGYNNLFVGHNSGMENQGSGNVFLGHRSGELDTNATNTLIISNSQDPNPLVYGRFDSGLLRVNGELQIGSTYKFPTAAGTANQILKTNGSGQLSWQNDNVNDADADPGNELLGPVTLNFPMLEILDAGGLQTVDLSPLISDADADPTNELQTLSVSSDSISISGGNKVQVPARDLIRDFDGDTRVIAQDYPFGNDDIVDFYVDNNKTFGVADGYLKVFNNNGNIAIGSLTDTPTGSQNTFIGDGSGRNNLSGRYNTFLGNGSGNNNSTGSDNVFIGMASGFSNTTGSGNTFIGAGAGQTNATGNKNTYVGEGAGSFVSNDSMNVCIGYRAGSQVIGSNQLFIDNSSTPKPLIYGEFDTHQLNLNGSVRIDEHLTIGHSTSDAGLYIDSNHIQAYEIGIPFDVARSLFFQDNNGGDIILGGTPHFSKAPTSVGIGLDNPVNPLHIQNSSVPSSSGILKSEFTGTTSTDAYAIHGVCKPTDNWGYGGYFEGGFMGSESRVDGASGNGSYYGARGFVTGTLTGSAYGIFGSAGGNGNAYGVYGTNSSGSGTHYAVYANGDLAYTGSFINASDARLKKDISDIDSALELVAQLEPKSYAFKTEEYAEMNLPQGSHFGFIAQDLETVIPSLVKSEALATREVDKNERNAVPPEKMKGVNYIEMIPILTKAIQEQQEIINALKLEIEALKN